MYRGERRIPTEDASTPRMILPHHLSQLRAVHPGVDLGGRDVAVAEKLLDDPQVGASRAQVGGVADAIDPKDNRVG